MKLQTLTTLVLFVSVLASCNQTKKQSEGESAADTLASEGPRYTLNLKWETDTVLTTCESVIYDQENDILYVSNIEGKPDDKDGKGSISQVGLDGTVKNRDWIAGLNAPKGMGIHDGKLYVADIDQVVAIDIKGGKVLKKYPVDGAKFLNDIAVTDDGVVFISDTGASKIVQLKDGKISSYIDSIASPNGLFVESGSLITALWDDKKVQKIDMESQEASLLAEGLANPDGIEASGDGGYLVSNWEGEVTYVFADGEKQVLLDTRDQDLSAADIEFIVDKKLLLVPAFFGNKVMAYELVQE